MLKFLKGVVAGSGGGGLKELPYNIGEPYSSAWGSWIHYRGTSKVFQPKIPWFRSFNGSCPISNFSVLAFIRFNLLKISKTKDLMPQITSLTPRKCSVFPT
jgi:hypothetical protein